MAGKSRMAGKRKIAANDPPHEWQSPPPVACRLMAKFTRAADPSLCGGRSALDGSGSGLYGDLTSYGALGDLEERYNRIASKSGKTSADSWYWSQVAFAFPGFLTNLIYWSVIMFRNYFKVTMRNIARHKWYSTINILGLALGITACVLILLWVQDELSYDRMYPEAKRVFRVYRYLDRPGGLSVSGVSPAGLAPMLERDYPGVEKAARLMNHNFVLGNEDRRFNELVALVDPQMIDILSIKFLRGDPATALSELEYIVITRELAEKYFGDEDPIGKGLQVETWYTATVMGVIENRPEKSTVRHFDAMINFNIYAPLWRRDLSDLAVGNYNTYLMTAPEARAEDVQASIIHALQPFYNEQAGISPDAVSGEEFDAAAAAASVPVVRSKVLMHPLLKERLHDIQGGGLITYLIIFSAVGILILLIACSNYMNLSTARSGKRAMEVGIRRVVGADRPQLARQFFGEALIVSTFSAVVAVLFTYLALPWFNDLSGKELVLSLTSSTILIFAGIALVTGLISGSYPAIVLSSFKPAATLKGKARSSAQRSIFRRVLVVSQFTISIFLIIASLIVFNQLRFIRTADIGYELENVVTFTLTSNINRQYESFRNTLEAHPGVTGVTRTNSPPVYLESTISGNDLSWEGKTANDHVSNFGLMGVGPGFDRIFRPKMVAGRFFDEEIATDLTGAAIINEAALKLLGLQDPLGKSLTVNDRTYSIIGVVKDFNLESLHKTVNPMAILPNWGIDCVCVGMRSGEGGAPAASSPADRAGTAADITGTDPAGNMAGAGIDDVLAFIQTTVRQFDPGAQLNYRFLDEMRMDNYATEMRTERIVKYGTGMAIFISCLGLLGLAAYTAEQRTKEIGIRKVLGASVGGIILLLSRSFIRWVLISNLIAWPLAWFAGRKWLENFAYRTPMDIWVFLVASLAALAFAVGITAWQAWRAAKANPIDSLKYE